MNIYMYIIMITHVTNKVIINLKWRKCNLFKLFIKENIKYIKFNQFFNYFTHNKNEFKASPKIRTQAKETSGNSSMKDNFMARY